MATYKHQPGFLNHISSLCWGLCALCVCSLTGEHFYLNVLNVLRLKLYNQQQSVSPLFRGPRFIPLFYYVSYTCSSRHIIFKFTVSLTFCEVLDVTCCLASALHMTNSQVTAAVTDWVTCSIYTYRKANSINDGWLPSTDAVCVPGWAIISWLSVLSDL